MMIDIEKLQKLHDKFLYFVKIENNEIFINFKDCKIFQKEEGYKEQIYNEARSILTNELPKKPTFGNGDIHKIIVSTINVTADYSQPNNLVNYWTVKDNFKKIIVSNDLEETLFKFYKTYEVDEDYFFNELHKLKLSYNLIAYLFFIKDREKYLPISQQRFNKIFESLKIQFDMNETSWDNYKTFISIIKDVKDFLKKNKIKTTLLDAHSFVWFTGNRILIEEEQNKLNNNSNNKME